MHKLMKVSFKLLDLLVVFMMTFGSPMSVLADPSPTGATIASDQTDYPPGATVTLTGTGWASGESAHIFVNDDAGQTWSLNSDPDPVADDGGGFTYQFDLPSWFVANYSVTASGDISGTATTSFTDLNIGTYDQCSNDLGSGYTTGDTGCRWINGNLQGNNSIYNEGDATVQRLWLTDLAPGSTHTVTFKYGTTKGGKHAYDFLTRWDWSENWITVADRCQGISGCETATDTYTAIPIDPNATGFDAAADLIQPRQFTMRGGTLNSATVPVIVSGDYTGDSETVITVNYTVGPNNGSMCTTDNKGVTTCGVAIWFGAHVALTAQWMAYNGTTGAATISGSPYHVSLDAVDGASVGQRDNQMQSGAVPLNGTIKIVKDAVPDDPQDFSFNITNGSTFSQNFTLDDDGGSDATYPNSMSFSLPAGTYTASELSIPGGWTLTNLVCQVTGSNGSTTSVDLASGKATINLVTSFTSSDTVICTYTDTKIVNKNLTVTKTATPSFSRTYSWLIDKSVDQTKITFAEGGKATFNYTVDVTPNGYSDTSWAVSGKITVSNPNAFAISGVDVTDSIDNGGSCTVTNGTNVTVPGNDKVVLDYSCTYASDPSSATGTNTATATWNKDTYYTPDGTASGTAGVDFGSVTPTETNKVITVIDDKTDPQNPVTLGTSDYFNGPFEFKYSLDKEGVAGTCTDYTNTATIKETKQSDSQKVTVCVGKDLTVSKTASGTFNREYLWKISKSVDKTSVTIADGGSYTFHYTVDVEQTGVTDSGWTLSGKITISNPNDFEAITLTSLSDAVDNGGTCTVDAGPYVVPASGSIDVNYSCSFGSAPSSYSGKNTATAEWDKATYFTPSGSASGSADFTLSQKGATNKTIHVTDSYAGDLGTVDATDTAPFATASFPYDRKESGVAGTCTKYDNTATITETDQSSRQEVTLCVAKDLTVSKTAAGTFDREYLWKINKSVDKTSVTIAAGGDYTFHYTVDVEQTGIKDSGWTLSGKITISNPNDFEAIMLTGITDVVDNGGTCTVDPTLPLVPKGGSVDVNYSCTFPVGGPTSYSGKNTATVTWDKALAFTPTGTASGEKDFTLSQKGSTNKTIHVTDSYAGDLGTVDATDSSPFAKASFTYDRKESGVAGTCTKYDNTATITETGAEASQEVTLCVAKDLTVSKTVNTSYTRTFKWMIDKSVDETKVLLEGTSPQSATFNYTVAVSHDSGTDSAWALSGKITISNPNAFEDITVDVTDVYDGGGTCTVTGGSDAVIPAGQSVELSYSCNFATQPAYTGTNTAKAVWDKATYFTPSGEATGTKAVDFGSPTTIVDGEVTVTDTYAGTLGTVKYSDPSPMNFTYSRTIVGTVSKCVDYDNTATFKTNTTGTTGSDSQTVTVCESQLNVIKLTKGVIDPTKDWKFSLFDGPHANDPFSGFGSVLAGDTSLGKVDGVLNFGNYSLDPSKTYTFCETNAPSGWASLWTYNGLPITPYNPDRFAAPGFPNGQDLGNRCFDFGAGTSYPIPEGGTITFTVDNRFPGGEPRTIGFWKNWNTCTNGGQQYTATKNAGYDGDPSDPAASQARIDAGYFLLDDVLNPPGITIGSFTIPASDVTLSVTIGKKTVTKTGCEIAVDLLAKTNWFTNKNAANDAAYGLAAQLIAAKANLTAGAKECIAIDNAILQADNLLTSITFNGTGDYLGPKVKGAMLTTRNNAISIADTIDKYNNGMLCP